MKGHKLNGVRAKVAVDDARGMADGIAFGAFDGRLLIGIASQGKTYFVALAGDSLNTASHSLADALQQVCPELPMASGAVQ